MMHNENLEDIIDCIVKFDKTATDYEKARYFEIIKRDLKALNLKKQTKKIMYRVKVNFWAGFKEEIIDVEIFNKENEEQEIIEAFHKWLDNVEDVGFEKLP